MKNITIDFLNMLPLERQQIELAERKGVGHPDSICDGIAESVSRTLSREYIKRFGVILHHNTDQCELIGGRAKPAYKGGRVVKPQYVLLGGRATAHVGKEAIPVGDIAVGAAKKYLSDNFKELNVSSDVVLDQKIGEGSADLQSVFKRNGIPKSNDTSFGVGYAPLSTLEKLTLEASNYLNHKCKIKAAGKDTKVMGVRKNSKIILTVACAMVGKYLNDLEHYRNTVGQIRSELVGHLSKKTPMEVEVDVNTADDYQSGDVYLTVTGLSSEQGDDGSVGRGNRANGLIAPFRPVSLEATAGKNPVNHVGKIYNLLASKMAEDIAKAGAEQIYVRLMSQIGKPIDQPLVASLQLIGDRKMESKAREIADYWLEHVTEVKEWCISDKVSVF
ncbi:MAG: methionine adenosyltransferase [Candidatus Altiarchaeales archaeon]|nr:methionine adenosyltransferase [Candidatus Altiarchaeales archaeon]